MPCMRQDVLKRTRRRHVHVTGKREGLIAERQEAFRRVAGRGGDVAKDGQIRESRGKKGRDRNLLNLTAKRDSRVTGKLIELEKEEKKKKKKKRNIKSPLCYVTSLMKVYSFPLLPALLLLRHESTLFY